MDLEPGTAITTSGLLVGIAPSRSGACTSGGIEPRAWPPLPPPRPPAGGATLQAQHFLELPLGYRVVSHPWCLVSRRGGDIAGLIRWTPHTWPEAFSPAAPCENSVLPPRVQWLAGLKPTCSSLDPHGLCPQPASVSSWGLLQGLRTCQSPVESHVHVPFLNLSLQLHGFSRHHRNPLGGFQEQISRSHPRGPSPTWLSLWCCSICKRTPLPSLQVLSPGLCCPWQWLRAELSSFRDSWPSVRSRLRG